VIVILDTSGSVSEPDLKTFITECIELKTASENGGDAASEVLIFSADTIARGDPVELTDSNIDEMMSVGIKVFGRGGTDFGQSLRDVIKSPVMKDRRPRSIVYFTDLFDSAPSYKDLGLEKYGEPVNIVFVAAETTHSAYYEEWARKVESWARVVSLKEGGEVDLEDTKSMKVSPSRR
jgi:predicted metal-dependent peptidase